MLFTISFLLFVIYVAILLKNKNLRWVAWLLFAVYFGVIVLFGDMLKAVFDMEDGSRTFFMFLAVLYTAVPLLLAEATAKVLGRKST